MRGIVGLALDALASTSDVPDKVSKQNQRIVQAMRLRYGLDDDRPVRGGYRHPQAERGQRPPPVSAWAFLQVSLPSQLVSLL